MIMPAWCSCMQNSASPSILARLSSQGYQKVLEFTGRLENAARPAVRWTESTTPINPRSKEIYKLWFLLLLAFAWLQHPVLELSWPASASIIQSAGFVCRSIHEGEYVFPNIAVWLSGWLVCIDASICSRGHVWLVVHHACQLVAHTRKTVQLHQYLTVSQAKGIKKY